MTVKPKVRCVIKRRKKGTCGGRDVYICIQPPSELFFYGCCFLYVTKNLPNWPKFLKKIRNSKTSEECNKKEKGKDGWLAENVKCL